jgi:hypothetical protein
MLTRKRVSLLLVLLVSCSISPTLRAPPQAGVSQQTSLYRRLGGYDGIAALTDDLFARVATDPQLSHFFKGIAAIRKSVSGSTLWSSSAPRPVAPASIPDAT